MSSDKEVENLIEICLRGERHEIRSHVDSCLKEHPADELLLGVVLPAIEKAELIDREDRATASAFNVLMISLRLVTGRLVDRLANDVKTNESPLVIAIYSGACASEELQGEIITAILECDGHQVRYAGGGVPADEILSDVGRLDPDVLLLFASAASDAPAIREVIDTIRDIGARPLMQIVIGGGVFSRAPGLAEEIGADLWTDEPSVLRLAIVEEHAQRAIPEQRTVGRTRRQANRAA